MITLTTLNNNAAVAKTFTEIAKDKTSAEWVNTTDSTSTLDVRMSVKQQILSRTKTGVPIRRSLVQVKAVAPTSVVLNGNTTTIAEEITMNFTIISPTALATLTPTTRADLLAYLENMLSPTVIEQLVRGEV